MPTTMIVGDNAPFMPRVLCVDDEPLNLTLLEAILSSRGYDVVSAMNGAEALEIIRTERVDICLLDVMMPGLDGFEVCRLIKSDKKHNNIPVIMITAHHGMEKRIQAAESGAEDFITKPFNISTVLASIDMLLHVKAQNDSANQDVSPNPLLESFRNHSAPGMNDSFAMSSKPDTSAFLKELHTP
jgi:DNA-binding response OmpR family regulator